MVVGKIKTWKNMELEKAGKSRDKQGKFVKGVSGNPQGLTKLTEEQKLEKKANKVALDQRITEYKEKLGDALPLISPALIKKAKSGDVPAIKEIHAILIGKDSTKVDVTVRGAIAHGHFYPEDDAVEAEVEAEFNRRYKENMRKRIKDNLTTTSNNK